MKVSDFRLIADGLARFANIRETAKPPENRIGVQVGGGRLKLVSGNSRAGMVVDIQEEAGRFSYTIEARTFLNAAKALGAKDEVSFNVTEDKLEIVSAKGGKVVLKAVGSLKDAGFAKKPKTFEDYAVIPATSFKKIATLFKDITSEVEVPGIQHTDGWYYMTAVSPGNRPTYAWYRVRDDADPDGLTSYYASAYADFWDALRAFKSDGEILFGGEGVLARSSIFECYSGSYKVSKYDRAKAKSELPKNPEPWPIIDWKGEPSVSFTVEKKRLIDMVKAYAPRDEHNRVTFIVTPTGLTVTPFGDEEGMEIQTKTTGAGARSVNADYLLGLLRAIDAKETTLMWLNNAPAIRLTAEGYENWMILLAPVTLR